jgi:hypothetical protein
MSSIFNSTDINPQGTVTQAQLTAATNKCVKKSQLTKTGGANLVPQYDSTGNLSTASGARNLIALSAAGLQAPLTSGAATVSGSILVQQDGSTNYAAIFQTNVSQIGSTPTNGILIQNMGNGAGTVNLDMCNYYLTSSTNPTIRLQALDDGNSSGHLLIWTKNGQAGGTGTFQERMRIQSNGFVGIGKSPSVMLDVSGAASFGGVVTCSAGLTIASGQNITQSGAGSLTVGSGGISTTGKLTSYNGLTLNGFGLPVLVGALGTVNGSATNVNIFNFGVPAVDSEYYMTMVCDVSAISGGAINFPLSYTTSPTGGSNTVMNTGLYGTISTNTGATTGSNITSAGQFNAYTITIHAKASTSITVTFNSTAATNTWSAYVKLFQIA